MANPNIVNVTEIYGNTSAGLVATSNSAVVTNASNSGKIYKINSVYIANFQGTNAADITVEHVDGSNNRSFIASTVSVAADSTVVLITKDSSIYLKEGCTINLLCNLSSHLHHVTSWDEIK